MIGQYVPSAEYEPRSSTYDTNVTKASHRTQLTHERWHVVQYEKGIRDPHSRRREYRYIGCKLSDPTRDLVGIPSVTNALSGVRPTFRKTNKIARQLQIL